LHGLSGSHRIATFLAGWAVASQRATDAVATAAQRARQVGDADKSEATTSYLVALTTSHAFESWLDEAAMTAFVDGLINQVKPLNAMFLDALADEGRELTPAQRARIAAVAIDRHLVCTIAAALLEVRARIDEVVDDLASEAAKVLAAALFPDGLANLGARMVAESVFKKAAAQLVSAWTDEHLVLMLRFVGAVCCPDWEKHPGNDVWTYCVSPLIGDALEERERAWAKDQLTPLF
jgi:hypothetical protein